MDLPVPQKVNGDALVPKVQSIMYAAGWEGSNTKWQNLVNARDNFVLDQLNKLGFTIDHFKAQSRPQQRTTRAVIMAAFSAEFYKYTRDGKWRDGTWRQEAVGNDDRWIMIDGMAYWHTRQALIKLVAKKDSSAMPQDSSGQFSSESGSSSKAAPPFDPVRDSIRNNPTDQ